MEPLSIMVKPEKLYSKALRSQNNFSFRDLCSLAEKVGFVFKRQEGSHRIYHHPILKRVLNLQPFPADSKIAKPYQVKQLLRIIEDHGLIESEK